MKFVYGYANLNDVEILYDVVKRANSKIPMKPITQVKSSVVLGQPLAVSDYLLDLDQYAKVPGSFNNSFWTPDPNYPVSRFYKPSTNFLPSLTDAGLCSVYNSPMISDVFEPSSVAEFKKVFINESQQTELKTGSMGEYTFVVDTRKRSQYPFKTTDPKLFAK